MPKIVYTIYGNALKQLKSVANYIINTYRNMFLIILYSNVILKCSPYAVRFTNKFIGIMCKSNTKSFNDIDVAIRFWNTLPNSIKTVET